MEAQLEEVRRELAEVRVDVNQLGMLLDMLIHEVKQLQLARAELHGTRAFITARGMQESPSRTQAGKGKGKGKGKRMQGKVHESLHS